MGPNDFCAGCAGEKLVAAQQEIERLKNDHHAPGRWPDCKHCVKFFSDDEGNALAYSKLKDELDDVYRQLDAAQEAIRSIVRTNPFLMVDAEVFDAVKEAAPVYEGNVVKEKPRCECGPYDAGCIHRFQ